MNELTIDKIFDVFNDVERKGKKVSKICMSHPDFSNLRSNHDYYNLFNNQFIYNDKPATILGVEIKLIPDLLKPFVIDEYGKIYEINYNITEKKMKELTNNKLKFISEER